MEVKARHHLRSDEIDELRSTIESTFGATVTADSFEAVTFAESPLEVILMDGSPAILRREDGPVLTVRGANETKPTKRIVTVDEGAVSFISDGADIMRPGIVEADEEIEPGDPVLITEETHGKFLAVGEARVAGSEMLGDAGKVIDTFHHVGDDLYAFTP